MVNETIPQSFLNAPVRFDAADRFSMRATKIANSIEDGLLIGGGSDHRIGVSTGDVALYGSQSDALTDQSGDQEVFELSSFRQSNVSAIPTIVDEGLLTERELLAFDVDSGASTWLREFLPDVLDDEDGFYPVSSTISVHGKNIPSNVLAEGLVVSNNLVTRLVTNLSSTAVEAFFWGYCLPWDRCFRGIGARRCAVGRFC